MMKKRKTAAMRRGAILRSGTQQGKSSGFSLVELMVAMAIFMVIGGAAISLVRKHVPLVSAQQGQVGLNIAMRNAVAQMQIDIVNAGAGYYQGSNVPSWPIGVTVKNNPAGTNCYNSGTHTYGATCFDSMTIISSDNTTSAAHPSSDSAGTACADTTQTGVFLTLPGTPTAANYTALANKYKTGDQILLVQGRTHGFKLTSAKLTADGQVSGGVVQLTHGATQSDGSNPLSNDPFGITNSSDAPFLATSFCPATDWIIKLAPITYGVDTTTNPTNPMLTKTVGGVTNVVAEQVIGFKVGASLWNGNADNPYVFNDSTYSDDWSLIRSVRISLIGRTVPSTDPNNNFRNTFDQGPYKVQGIAVVVNPRNLSMNDI